MPSHHTSHKRQTVDTNASVPASRIDHEIYSDEYPNHVEEVYDEAETEANDANLIRRRFTPIVNPLASQVNAEVVDDNEYDTKMIAHETDAIGRFPNEQPVVLVPDIFDDMSTCAIDVYNKASKHKLDFFLYGILAGTHLPAVAWLSLAYIFCLPTLMFLQNPDWLPRLRENHFAALPVAIGLMAIADTYALYCVSRTLF